MRHTLLRHPDSAGSAVNRIDVELIRPRPARLEFRYLVLGEIDALRLAPVTAARRRHGLWRHSCFEAFARAAGPAYVEFNFAPSLEWAAFRFKRYREGMHDLASLEPPHVEIRADSERFELNAALDLIDLPELAEDTPWRLAITAVIEQADGAKSYWALAHPPGKADFHHPDGFVLELPPP